MKNLFLILMLCLNAVGQSGANGALTASTTASADLANNGIVVAFRAVPPNAIFTKFHWEFGDYAESTSEQISPFHRYTRPGYFTVHLRMSDSTGKNQSSAEIHIRVNTPVEINPQ